MKTRLMIAAVACLGLVACQQGEAPKEEKAATETTTMSAEQAMPAAQQDMTMEQQPAGQTDQAAPAEQQASPANPGTSYYDNNQNASLAEQANPAIDAQQQTANAQTADAQDTD